MGHGVTCEFQQLASFIGAGCNPITTLNKITKVDFVCLIIEKITVDTKTFILKKHAYNLSFAT